MINIEINNEYSDFEKYLKISIYSIKIPVNFDDFINISTWDKNL